MKKSVWIATCLAVFSLLANAKEKQINVVFIGNSITYGAGLPQPAKEAPPVKAAAWLATQSGIGSVKFSNQGVSGATTVDFLPETHTLFPKVIQAADQFQGETWAQLLFSVMLGTNDSAMKGTNGAPVAKEQYRKNMETIIDSLLNRYPGAQVVVNRPVWYSPNTYNGAMYLEEGLRRLESYYPVLRSMVAHYEETRPGQVRMGDEQGFDYFREHHLTDYQAEPGNAGTFYLHPNEQGAVKLGHLWGAAIYRVLQGEVGAEVTRADYQRSDTILKLNNRVYGGAVRPAWLDSSAYFWYKNQERGGEAYYLVNAKTGQRHRADNREGLAAFLPKRDKALAESLLKDPEPRYRNWKREEPKPVVSPDGQWEAYIKDHNVYVAEVQKEGEKMQQPRKEVALTLDGSVNLPYDAEALQWSPDGRKLATLRVRKVEERRIPLIESAPASQKQPILQWRDYAKPGDVLPVSLPVLIDVEQQKVIPVNAAAYEEQFWLNLTGWRADSRAFTFEFNQRGHQRYVVGEVDATTGEIRTMVDEQMPTFIHYYKNFRYDLNDGREMLWISERDGWRHLYRIDGATGQVKQQITKGEWVVREVDYVDEAQETIYFYASGFHAGEDPYNLHYCQVRFDGTGFTDLTPEAANHHVYPSADRAYFVDSYSRPDLAPVSQLKRMDGSVVMPLEKADLSDLEAAGWVMPEVFCAKGRDGKTDIWGNVYRPTHFDPNRIYPVVEMIYAGPHDSHVDKDFKAEHHLISKLVELGFVVVSIDGMGTSNRSKAFHDVCWKNLKDAGFPDRIAWIKALGAKYNYLDLDRVGIYGWSAGGQNAMAALLWHNDFYKVAVALCGCHDNRMDKVWWNEQWMGYPLDASYSASSNVDNAALLKGKLLLINGELDDNVDPTSTLQVVKALMEAGKNFEQLYLPGKTHSLGGPFEMHKMHDFFVKHLKRQDPPAWE